GDSYRRWLSRARRFSSSAPALESIAARYDRVIERLLALPTTFIHGEFYASNVIVADARIVPIDWEMAAIGPSLMDVAALTAGQWSNRERQEIAAAYWEDLKEKSAYRDSFENLLESLEYCRLHQCIQWLGWAPQRSARPTRHSLKIWSPPKDHAQDWMTE